MNRIESSSIRRPLAVAMMCGWLGILSGCFGPSTGPIVLKTPMTLMVLESDTPAMVAVEDPDRPGELVHYGETVLYKGMTVGWYDWNREP